MIKHKNGDVTGYCLAHGEYHLMQRSCWDAILTFYFDQEQRHPGVTREELKNDYDAAVERKMLYNLANNVAQSEVVAQGA